MSIKSRVKKRIPLIRRLIDERDVYKKKSEDFEQRYLKANHLHNHFKTQFAPGHFYSPYPDLNEIKKRKSTLFNRSTTTIEGINVKANEQIQLINEISKYYKDLPFLTKNGASGSRYKPGMHAFSYTDAVIYYCLIRKLSPKRIIEIGSGYSSALTLDLKESHLPHLDVTFIEPYPELLFSLIKKSDSKDYTLLGKPLNEVSLDVFKKLESNDILFIDSTHVSKVGSDVNQIYFEILPKLKKGVVIHIHDVFWPFEYPYEWIKETRAWNEDYLLRAFLYKNPDYEVLVFNNFLNEHHSDQLSRLMPLTSRNSGGSLWLRKIK